MIQGHAKEEKEISIWNAHDKWRTGMCCKYTLQVWTLLLAEAWFLSGMRVEGQTALPWVLNLCTKPPTVVRPAYTRGILVIRKREENIILKYACNNIVKANYTTSEDAYGIQLCNVKQLQYGMRPSQIITIIWQRIPHIIIQLISPCELIYCCRASYISI